MRNNLFISSMFLMLLCFTQCAEDIEHPTINLQTELNFYSLNNSELLNKASGKLVYNSANERYEIISKDLIGVKSIHHQSGEIIYGYIHKNSKAEKVTSDEAKALKERFQALSNDNSLDPPVFEVKRGYFGYLDGCYYFGTLYVGDNGQEMFVPDTGTNAILNPPICPEGEWA